MLNQTEQQFALAAAFEAAEAVARKAAKEAASAVERAHATPEESSVEAWREAAALLRTAANAAESAGTAGAAWRASFRR